MQNLFQRLMRSYNNVEWAIPGNLIADGILCFFVTANFTKTENIKRVVIYFMIFIHKFVKCKLLNITVGYITINLFRLGITIIFITF